MSVSCRRERGEEEETRAAKVCAPGSSARSSRLLKNVEDELIEQGCRFRDGLQERRRGPHAGPSNSINGRVLVIAATNEWRLRSLLMVQRLEGPLEGQHDGESECDEADEGCCAEGGREALLSECAEVGGRR